MDSLNSCLNRPVVALLEIYIYQKLNKKQMETMDKEPVSPSNTLKSQRLTIFSASTTPTERQRQSYKRFNRSTNNSRSKSKEEYKIQDSEKFYVKNIFSQNQEGKGVADVIQKLSAQLPIEKTKKQRQVTPSKSRKQMKKQTEGVRLFNQSQNDDRLQDDVDYHEIYCQKQHLLMKNKELEEKLIETEIKLAESVHLIAQLQEKLTPTQVMKQNKSISNLLRLKKDIAQQHAAEAIPEAEILNEQLKKANAQILRLKKDVSAMQSKLKAKQLEMNRLYSERKNFLDELIQQLKLQLTKKDQLINRMRIQLNIFLVKQFKKGERSEIAKNEDYLNIKRKYRNLLLKYHEVTKLLASHKRERFNHLFGSSNQRDSDYSLSLSP